MTGRQQDVEPASEPDAALERLRELVDVAEKLADQATELRRQSDELCAALDQDGAPDDGPAPEDSPEPAATAESTNDTVRLVAVNMSLQGRTRSEVEGQLREIFGSEPDPAVLDDVFPAH